MDIDSPPPPATVYTRSTSSQASDDSGSNQTTIIIAACASVGGAIIAFIFFRIFRRLCRRRQLRPAPLPPVQPLAHHREQQLAQLEAASGSRPATWYDSTHLSPHTLGSASFHGSKTSLLGKEGSGSNIPSRHTSFGPSETAEDVSVLSGAEPMEVALPLPNPKFHAASPSSSSLGSNSDTENVQSSTPPPLTPNSVTSGLSNSTNSTQVLSARSRSTSASPARARPRSHRPRPISMTSTVSTSLSRTSRNTIRGMPHSAHSQVQIVLPAPLAPDLFPYMMGEDGMLTAGGRRTMVVESDGLERLSVVDKWAPMAVRSLSSLSRGERRSESTEPRTSTSSQSSNSHLSPTHRPPRRVASSPSSISHSYSPSSTSPTVPAAYRSFSSPLPPPVPRIPSMYNAYTPTEMMLEERSEEQIERGRPRGASVSAPRAMSGDLPQKTEPQLPQEPRRQKLQKQRSKSRGEGGRQALP